MVTIIERRDIYTSLEKNIAIDYNFRYLLSTFTVYNLYEQLVSLFLRTLYTKIVKVSIYQQ